MKTRLTTLTLLAAAITGMSAAPAMAGSREAIPTAFTVRSVVRNNTPIVQRCNTVMDVLRHLGVPDRKLDANVWVYYGFWGDHPQTYQAGCNNLIVVLAADSRVADLKLVNSSARQVLAAHLKTTPGILDGIFVAETAPIGIARQ